ncbi:MAG: hypothetical protein JKY33_10180, partial [Bacteroidia bacterium]|nr:hypothetical protein [Bacteroidia bacterium]
MEGQSRRKFIKTVSGPTVAICCGSAGLSVLMEGCTSIKSIDTTIKNNKVVLNKKEFVQNKFIVINDSKLTTPIYLNK